MTGRAPRATPRAPKPVQRAARAARDGVVRTHNLGVRAVSGDKPLALAFVAAFVASVVLLSGPMQSWIQSRDRVDLLQSQAAALEAANLDLERQRDDLNDPEQLELRAREDGFVRPGEVPYVVVPPEVDRPQIVEPAPDLDGDRDPWIMRLWQGLTSVFGE